MIDDISRAGIISTTSQDVDHDNSWGWAGKWREALRGGSTEDPSDTNGDGYVSMTEAYEWICPKSQAAGEHPMYDDNGDGVGHECNDPGFNPSNPSSDGFQGRLYSLDGWAEPEYTLKIVKPVRGKFYLGSHIIEWPPGPFRWPFSMAIYYFTGKIPPIGDDQGTGVSTVRFDYHGESCEAGDLTNDGTFTCDLHPTGVVWPPEYLTGRALDNQNLEVDKESVRVGYIGGGASGNTCWLGGTPITMANGSSKNIENIVIGDEVLVFDISTGFMSSANVTSLFHHSPNEMGDHYVVINGSIRVTPNHLLYLNHQLSAAGNTEPGDMLQSVDGQPILVESVQKVYEQVPTFNFNVGRDGAKCDPFVAYVANNIVAYPLKANLSAWLAEVLFAQTGTVDLSGGEANAINNNGEAAGYETGTGGRADATKWDAFSSSLRGQGVAKTYLAKLGGVNSDNFGMGINDTGEVAGYSETSAGDNHAFLWLPEPSHGLTAGTHDLGTLDGIINGRDSYGYDVNNSGQVVGQSDKGSFNTEAFLWLPTSTTCSPSKGKVRFFPAGMNGLGKLGGSESAGRAINENFQVTGWTHTLSLQFWHAFLWYCGTMTDLGTLPGGARSEGNDINDSGQVVGRGTVSGYTQWHAIVWLEKEACGFNVGMNDLGTLGGDESEATGINEWGAIVGWSKTSIGETHAFFYQGCRMVDLNDYIPAGSGWVLERANDINDDGRIVGDGLYYGQRHGFILTPVRGGDLDGDLDVDATDQAEFDSCYTGTGGVLGTGCEVADFDGDHDVDCVDWYQFVQAWTETGKPAGLEICWEGIELTVGREALTWTTVNGADSYDVIRGNLGELRESGGHFGLSTSECLVNDTVSNVLPYNGVPVTGEGFWFLVRGVAGSYSMTWDSLSESQIESRDQEIIISPRRCP